MDTFSEYIFTLLAAHLCGEELTPEEQEELERWKSASAENQRLYHHYQHFFEARDRLAQWEAVRLPSEDAVAHIFSTPSPGRRRLLTVCKYAAVIVPILVISTWLLFRQGTDRGPITVARQEVRQDILPGKQKAQLLLETGETVVLSDSSMNIRSHQNIQVGNGGVLQYAANKQQAKQKAAMHTLVVDRGAEFQLVLPDGTKVWLNSDSELKYPDVFSEDTRQVYLRGEAYFEVTHSEQQPFIVHAGECAVQVLGTAFDVASYEEEKDIVTTLVQGRVAYSAGQYRGELTPGEQCVYGKETKTAKVQKVDVEQSISWKNGLFVFDRVPMEQLARQISRWYDVEVVFPDQAARQVSFTGAMERYKPVSYLIQLLNETNTVDCRLEGNMLVFRQK